MITDNSNRNYPGLWRGRCNLCLRFLRRRWCLKLASAGSVGASVGASVGVVACRARNPFPWWINCWNRLCLWASSSLDRVRANQQKNSSGNNHWVRLVVRLVVLRVCVMATGGPTVEWCWSHDQDHLWNVGSANVVDDPRAGHCTERWPHDACNLASGLVLLLKLLKLLQLLMRLLFISGG